MSDAPDRREYWNERYAAQGSMWGADVNRFVGTELGGLSPRRVLDMACGQGRNAIWLAAQGHSVTAVDISDVAIGHARQAAEEAGVEIDFRAADLTQWEPEVGAYDLVLLSYVQLPAAMRAGVHAAAARAVAPGGMVFLIAHHRDNLEHGFGGPQSLDALFDETQMAHDFSSLHIVRNERVLRPVDKDGISGTAIDLLMIAEQPTG